MLLQPLQISALIVLISLRRALRRLPYFVGAAVVIVLAPVLIGAIEVAGEAANGRAALDLLGSTETDLVLLDIRMPEMDGSSSHSKFSEPPAIVFTTAYDACAIRAFELNAIDYVLKPVRAARLLEALKRVRSSAATNIV